MYHKYTTTFAYLQHQTSYGNYLSRNAIGDVRFDEDAELFEMILFPPFTDKVLPHCLYISRKIPWEDRDSYTPELG